jgi:hypothetical protein
MTRGQLGAEDFVQIVTCATAYFGGMAISMWTWSDRR